MRIKTFDATGIAPNGVIFAGDLNSIQDQYADQSNFGQTVDVATLRLGDSSLQITKFGTGIVRVTSSLNVDGILRVGGSNAGGILSGQYTTTQRDAITPGSRPYGMAIINATTNQWEWNSGTDATPSWKPLGLDPAASFSFSGGSSVLAFGNQSPNNYFIEAYRTGDANYRVRIREDGQYEIGPGGSTAPDIILSRPSTGTYQIGAATTILTGNLTLNGAAATLAFTNASSVNNIIASTKLPGDSQNRWQLTAGGVQSVGPGGSTAPDANWYRVAAGSIGSDHIIATRNIQGAANVRGFRAGDTGSYPLYIQGMIDLNGTSWIGHNAYINPTSNVIADSTHGTFGTRVIQFSYQFGIGFFANSAATTAGAAATPTERLRIANDGTVTAFTALVAPTLAAGNNTTNVATTAFVTTAISNDNPPGTVKMWAGSSASPPGGWLVCDGTAVSRTTYATLFSNIGTAFGAGNGSTTFNLPDFRGRGPLGAGTGAGLTNRVLGAIGGVENQALAIADLPSHDHGAVTGLQSADHTHTITTGTESADHTHSGTTGTDSVDHTHTFTAVLTVVASTAGGGGNYPYPPDTGTTSGVSAFHTHGFTTGGRSAAHTHSGTTSGMNVGHTHSVSAQGGGGAHNNMQPWVAVHFIIKT